MLLSLLLGLQIICGKPVILIITMMIRCVHIQSPQSFHNKSLARAGVHLDVITEIWDGLDPVYKTLIELFFQVPPNT